MRKHWFLMVMLTIAMMAFIGCSDDDDGSPTTPPVTGTPFEVMVAAGKAYINDSADCPGVLSAQDLFDNLDDYTVIDVRREDDYLAGHIPGAYHSSLGTVLDDIGTTIPINKPFVIACYSGQSAGHVKIALELMGYEDTYSLLFGMSSWNSTLCGSWDDNIGNTLTTVETDNNNGDLVTHDFPTLTGDANTIVASRVNAMLDAGFKGLSYDTIKDNLGDYFIINYFSQADYEGTGSSGVPGHIPGAFQFTPYQSLGDDQMLNNIPTNKPVVVYCWTGQHSSQVTAYLNMLGYEAYSLTFGSNNLFYDDLTAHKWSDAQKNDFQLETGYPPTEAFAAMAAAGADYINDSADCPGVISAASLHDNLELYTVIDIRSLTDYDAGHIEGAYHSSLGTLLDDVGTTIPTDKPMVVACYSGQSAGHAKIALELMGYEDTQSLLFGMSSWNSSLSGSWDNNIGNTLAIAETQNNNGDLTWHEYPTLAGENAATVVEDRVEAMLAAGFKRVGYTDIQDNLSEYFIVNYFSQADYEGTGSSGVPGHIPGAFQFTPYESLGLGEMLANLPTDMPIVVYCWTGQHSSQVTAYLNMLGYEAYSLTFGSNNLFYDDLTAHKWSDAQKNDFPLVQTPVFAMQ
jgi:rhodanese-related sulfurtransferase